MLSLNFSSYSILFIVIFTSLSLTKFSFFFLLSALESNLILFNSFSAATLPSFINSSFFDESRAEISLTSGLIKIEAFSLEILVTLEACIVFA